LNWQPGNVLALLGANGAGKSTLLNILATISQPNTGQLFIGGHDVKRQAMQVRTLLGVVLHKPLVYDSLTANENLQFYARLYGGHCQPAQQLLAQVGLAQVANETRPHLFARHAAATGVGTCVIAAS
jgi:heme exporter protein A